jgi:hypothetical protein
MGSVVIRRLVPAGAAALLLLFPASHAQTQRPQSPPRDPAPAARDFRDDVPAHLAVIDGSVTLERGGRFEPAEMNLPLLAGDRIRTQSGRVEIRFEDGSAFYLDESAQLDLLGDGLARLIEGQLRLAITRATTSLEYRVDTPAASVWIRAAGEYRVESYMTREAGPETDLTVIRGTAEIENDEGRTTVRAGQHAYASLAVAPSRAMPVNSAVWDEFDEWTEDQREANIGTVSVRYLPENVRAYGASFDHYGTWSYAAPHGYVWYPRVAPGWRPYSHGRWSFTAHYGWAWVGIDRWSWPTHHYGSWGFSAGGWYWVPGSVWAPAWVSWASAPGYVGWCPVGWNGRPVVGFYASAGYAVNPWEAWTILPVTAFGPSVWVTQHVVAPHRIPPTVRGQFAERPGAPRVAGTSTARYIEPVRAPTAPRRTAVPRRATTDASAGWSAEMQGATPRPSRAVASTSSMPSASGARAASVSAPSRAPAAVPRTWEVDPATAATSSLGGGARTARPTTREQPASIDPDAGDRTAPSRSRAVPSSGRVDAPRVEAPSASARPAPSTGPVIIYGSGRANPGARPAPPTAQPTEEPAAAAPSRVSRSRAPSSDSAPPASAGPPPAARPSPPSSSAGSANEGRAPSRAVERPSRSAPAAPAPGSAPPPQSTGEAPSRSRGTPAPPAALPAPSRGGGGGEPRAVPRARGGN